MTLTDATAIVTRAADDGTDLDLRTDYSGRGMYGETTAAVVGARGDISHYAEACGIDVRGLEWDNMGLDYVAY